MPVVAGRLVTKPNENHQRENTDTMPGREWDRRQKNIQLLTMVGTIQMIYKKEIQDSHLTTNQRRKNYLN